MYDNGVDNNNNNDRERITMNRYHDDTYNLYITLSIHSIIIINNCVKKKIENKHNQKRKTRKKGKAELY